jgi:hypothetical protein
VTLSDSISLVRFDMSGDLIETTEYKTAELNPEHIDFFEKKFKHLSGDLELPLESRLPGNPEFMEFRIGSDIHGAFVLYYFHDEVIFTSVILSGTNEECETEMLQVFKFLLLDFDESEDPSEEEINSVLSSDRFQFESVETRPVVIEIQGSDHADEAEQCALAATMNRHLAAAFLNIER